MGVSTDAILAFGFDLGELNDEDWQLELAEALDFYDGDVDELLSADFGLDTSHCGTDLDAMKKVPVDLIQHCSLGSPMYFLAVRGTVQTARRGYPHAIDINAGDGALIQPMRAFCTKHNIPWQEPKWHIMSFWETHD